jgi:hypothetical protein
VASRGGGAGRAAGRSRCARALSERPQAARARLRLGTGSGGCGGSAGAARAVASGASRHGRCGGARATGWRRWRARRWGGARAGAGIGALARAAPSGRQRARLQAAAQMWASSNGAQVRARGWSYGAGRPRAAEGSAWESQLATAAPRASFPVASSDDAQAREHGEIRWWSTQATEVAAQMWAGEAGEARVQQMRRKRSSEEWMCVQQRHAQESRGVAEAGSAAVCPQAAWRPSRASSHGSTTSSAWRGVAEVTDSDAATPVVRQARKKKLCSSTRRSRRKQ